MNKELAIRILSGEVLGTNEQTHEAVFMAIKALVEAEPVKHGKWIYKECEGIGYFVCSECGQAIWIEKDNHYCFNCGAKMDLDGVKA